MAMRIGIRGLGALAGALVMASGIAGAAQQEAPPKDEAGKRRMEKLAKRLRDLERRMADRDGALDRIEKRLDRLLKDRAPRLEPERDPEGDDENAAGRAREQIEQLWRRWEGAFGGRRFGGGRGGPRLFMQFNRPWLGVYIEPAPGDQKGAYVTRVAPGSPADKAGILPRDIILHFGGTPIESPGELTRAVHDRRVGEQVNVTVLRDGREQTVGVSLERNRMGFGGGFEFRLGDDLEDLFQGRGVLPEELNERLGGAVRGFAALGGATTIKSAATHGDHTITLGVTGAPVRLTSHTRRRLKLSVDQRREVRKVFAEARTDLTALLGRAAKEAAEAGGKFDFDSLDKKLDGFDAAVEKKLGTVLSAEQLKTWRELRRSGPARGVSVERKTAKPLPEVKPKRPADLEFF